MNNIAKIWWPIIFGVPLLIFPFKLGKVVGDNAEFPWLKRKAYWSVGIYTGSSPFDLKPPVGIKNPILSEKDVTDIEAEFLADPFMVNHDGQWFMFMEIMNKNPYNGDIGLATSEDGLSWKYERIVLDEEYHLSYPYVFQDGQNFYMVAQAENNTIPLYQATNFPYEWKLVKNIIENQHIADATIKFYNEKWWMFFSTPRDSELYVYYADDLLGEWTEHRQSPVVYDNPNIARPGGRVFEYDGRLFRLAQDCFPYYGNKVVAYEITSLTPEFYKEQAIKQNPVVALTGKGWNKSGMHTVDPHQLADGTWIAAVDGFRFRGFEKR